MQIYIQNTGETPIYEQIVSQIKAQILSGDLQEGDALPSMRTLAKELRISVITTKRAYEELEKQGYVRSVTGKGSFVAPKNLELIREENLRQIEDAMQQILSLAAPCGLSLDDLIQMLMFFAKGE